jgi:uroporphyrinogen decarboxylase
MLHICGNTELILADMALTGLDAIELDYKTPIRKIHSAYKDRITFSGNIDPTGVIAHGSPALVREKVIELLDLYRDSPRFILNAGCAIPPGTPEANIQMMVNTVKTYR